MYLVMLGPPGVGKGTQAKFLAEKFKIPTLSTGEMLRRAVNNNTDAGKKAQSYMDAGLLVPDEVVSSIVKERIAHYADGFILDGYPRNVTQAHHLDSFFDKKDELEVLYISAPTSVILKRISGRYTCKNCGKTYNKYFNPPKNDGVCDECGGTEFVSRKDDNEGAVKKRLEVYKSETEPLVQYFKERKSLVEVDGSKSIEEVKEHIDSLFPIK